MITIPQLDTPLELTFEQDPESGHYIVCCKEYPQAFAEGATQVEAEKNLAGVLEIMLRERGDDLLLQLHERKLQ